MNLESLLFYHFSKLAEYDLVEYEDPTRARTYRVIDKELKPNLELPAQITSR